MSNNNKKTDVKSKDKLALCNDIAAVFTDWLIFLIDLFFYSYRNSVWIKNKRGKSNFANPTRGGEKLESDLLCCVTKAPLTSVRAFLDVSWELQTVLTAILLIIQKHRYILSILSNGSQMAIVVSRSIWCVSMSWVLAAAYYLEKIFVLLSLLCWVVRQKRVTKSVNRRSNPCYRKDMLKNPTAFFNFEGPAPDVFFFSKFGTNERCTRNFILYTIATRSYIPTMYKYCLLVQSDFQMLGNLLKASPWKPYYTIFIVINWMIRILIRFFAYLQQQFRSLFLLVNEWWSLFLPLLLMVNTVIVIQLLSLVWFQTELDST